MDTERLYTIASISADTIFEYSSAAKTFTVFVLENGKFNEKFRLNADFEQYFIENGYIFEDDIDSFEQFCDNVRCGIDRAAFEIRVMSGDSFRWQRIKMKTIHDEHSIDAFHVIGKFEDVSYMKDAEQRLIDKAERDPMTQIYNKLTTKRLIKNYLRTDSRDTFDAFIIVDVDNFKQINDNLGHPFGDSVLIDLSQEMQDLFRSNDVVGRIGGDEFIVFLRGMKNISHIESKAREICMIFDLLYSDDEGTKITGSLGISLFPRDGDTFDELYKRADIALYTSKRAGKSCYTFYDKEKDNNSEEKSVLPRVEQYHVNMDFLRQSSDFESSLTNFVFDITENKVDEDALQQVFARTGKHFALSSITVYNFDSENNTLTASHQWRGKNVPDTLGTSVVFSDTELLAFMKQLDHNLIFMTEIAEKGRGAFNKYLSEKGVKSCIASAKCLNGRLEGVIAFEEAVSPRVWSIDEARAVNAMKRLVFSYLLRVIDEKNN